MAIEKLEHVGIMVKDLETSISFYQDIIGLDVIDKFHPAPSIKIAFLGYKTRGEIIIELIQGSKEGLPAEGKVNHIAFTVSEIEKEMERLKAKKVNFTQKDIHNLSGSKYIFFRGPDGELLELFQPAT
ncbi:VOC family protein [Metabacillus sp. GX 13764]|uniref:VOC family protein n=1 Tax=Metabacillus kandeliae TaxID=2900151 RepID=UPI001E641E64|nr:VOC family protein [Metabacillus kandeliae]MCD7034148.1 VOC family protein [Metabacillus kandeliae]